MFQVQLLLVSVLQHAVQPPTLYACSANTPGKAPVLCEAHVRCKASTASVQGMQGGTRHPDPCTLLVYRACMVTSATTTPTLRPCWSAAGRPAWSASSSRAARCRARARRSTSRAQTVRSPRQLTPMHVLCCLLRRLPPFSAVLQFCWCTATALLGVQVACHGRLFTQPGHCQVTHTAPMQARSNSQSVAAAVGL